MPKQMKVWVDKGELLPIEPETVERSKIGPGGARGLWDGFGLLTILVGDREVMHIRVCEDALGEVVIRAIVNEGLPYTVGNDAYGGLLDACIEEAGLIDPDTTSRDRGWIKE